MSRRHSIAEARNHLPELVRQAESGKPVELTRRGEPVAELKNYTAMKDRMLKRPAVQRVLADEGVKL